MNIFRSLFKRNRREIIKYKKNDNLIPLKAGTTFHTSKGPNLENWAKLSSK